MVFEVDHTRVHAGGAVLGSMQIHREGEMWCAYFVPQNSTKEASGILLGSIRADAIKDNKRRSNAFALLMLDIARQGVVVSRIKHF